MGGVTHTKLAKKHRTKQTTHSYFLLSCAVAVLLVQATGAILFSVTPPPGRHALDVLRLWIAGELSRSAPRLALARLRVFVRAIFAVRVPVALPKARYAVAAVASEIILWALVVFAVVLVGAIPAVLVAITSGPYRQAVVVRDALELLRRTGIAGIDCPTEGERLGPDENSSKDERRAPKHHESRNTRMLTNLITLVLPPRRA